MYNYFFLDAFYCFYHILSLAKFFFIMSYFLRDKVMNFVCMFTNSWTFRSFWNWMG